MPSKSSLRLPELMSGYSSFDKLPSASPSHSCKEQVGYQYYRSSAFLGKLSNPDRWAAFAATKIENARRKPAYRLVCAGEVPPSHARGGRPDGRPTRVIMG